MQLTIFAMLLSVLLGKVLAEQWPQLAAENGVLAVSAIVALFAAAGRLTMAYAAALLDLHHNPHLSLQVAHRNRHWITWLWILSSPWLLAATGWGSTVDLISQSLGVQGSALVAILFWSLPSFTFCSLFDYSWFEFEKHFRSSRCVKLALGREGSLVEPVSFLSFWWNQLKHSWLMVAVPALLVCAILDVAKPAQIAEWSIAMRAALYALAIGVGMVALPELTVWSWNAKPLPEGEAKHRLEQAWRSLGNRPQSILIWSSNMRMCNAMIVGYIPWRRRLLISDLMLARLPLSQLEMILCHEAAHIRRNHIVLRALPFVGSLLSILILRAIYESSPWVREWSDANTILLASLAILKLVFILGLSSLIARWTEKDADKYAVQIAKALGLGQGLQETNEQPIDQQSLAASTVNPAEVLIAALKAASLGTNRQRSSWLYPSVNERCNALRAVAQSPA